MVNAMSQIEATPLSPLLGAQVSGCDFTKGISGKETETLRQLLRKYFLLVFRAPDLDAEAHVRFVGLFGTVRGSLADGLSYSMVQAQENEGIGYHVDFSFTRVPLPVVSLWAAQAEGDVAASAFLNAVQLCARLPAALRARIAGRTVFHASDIAAVGQRSARRLSRAEAGDGARNRRGTSHPAILVHPETGEEILFVDEYLSISFDGMDPEESDGLLNEIFEYLYAPENIYTHRWRTGDLMVFDNLALQHCRTQGGRRTLRRVIVSESPLAEIMP